MNKISRVSFYIKFSVLLMALGHFALWLYTLLSQDSALSSTLDHQSGASLGMHLVFDDYKSEVAQLNAIGANGLLWLFLPDMAFFGFLYWCLFSLFAQYQQGDVFSSQSANLIRRIGMCLLIWPLVSFLYPPMIIIALKLAGAVEHGEIGLLLGSSEFRLLATGVVVTVAGWIMQEAQKLKEEQELTV